MTITSDMLEQANPDRGVAQDKNKKRPNGKLNVKQLKPLKRMHRTRRTKR